jgi:flagellar L-ring protein precursor FlgH
MPLRLSSFNGVFSGLSVFVLFLSGCATPQLPPPPPKYIYHEEKIERPSRNSLWNDTASLYEDIKARRLNDLVTIKVVENIAGSGKADTNTSRDSALDAQVTNFFGTPTILNAQNFWGNGYAFEPKVQGSMKNEFKGEGETNRSGRLVGTITAKVVEVMPNGNLVLESRKDLIINNERQTLVLTGMVRPDDIAPDNSVLSSRIADAEIFFVGKGVLQEKQSPGWFTRVRDTGWPF